MTTGEPSALHESIVAWLKSPEAYDPRPASVELIETHISCVFLAGQQVFKLKKPLHYDFLDYRTLAAREHACREEVRLNRRLAAAYYLGVRPIMRTPSGDFAFGGEGVVVDYVVEMRRIPTHLSLDRLFRAGQLTERHIRDLADTLAKFFDGLKPVKVTPEEYLRRELAHVQGNSRELLAVGHHLQPASVRRVQSFQHQLLLLQPELFEDRVRQGRIFDGHGDLRPEHICFADPIAIFDCIEFSEDFRRIDSADELAFLAAECDALGADWVGTILFEQFAARTDDHPPPVLIDFYKAYRAAVRAKVAALRADQVEGAAHEQAVADALNHLQLADRYASGHLQPITLIVGGFSGTGKSTLATALADTLCAELIRSDVVRQSTTKESDPELRYHAHSRQCVYEEMFRTTYYLLKNKVSVVLDATFSTTENVQRVASIAQERGSLVLAIECTCRSEVARARIARRLATGIDASEARPELYEQQRQAWQPWPGEVPQCRIHTERPIEEQVSDVLTCLKSHISR